MDVFEPFDDTFTQANALAATIRRYWQDRNYSNIAVWVASDPVNGHVIKSNLGPYGFPLR